MPGLPVTAADPAAAAGLSPRARDLWSASLRYRRLADDLAARASAEPTASAAESLT